MAGLNLDAIEAAAKAGLAGIHECESCREYDHDLAGCEYAADPQTVLALVAIARAARGLRLLCSCSQPGLTQDGHDSECIQHDIKPLHDALRAAGLP